MEPINTKTQIIPSLTSTHHLLGMLSILLMLTACHGKPYDGISTDSSNNSGSAQPVLQQPATSQKAITTETNEPLTEGITGPTTEALLAQILPPNSCKNTLENLKFAMEQKLFLHENFYTETNVKKLLGDYYEIRFQADFSNPFWTKSHTKTRHLDAFRPTSKNPWDTLETGDMSSMPCIVSPSFVHITTQLNDQKIPPYNSITTYINIGIDSTGSGMRKVTRKQLEATFGPPEKVLPILSYRRHRFPDGKVVKIEKGLKAAFYRFQNADYGYSMDATINKAGEVYAIHIEAYNRP